MIFTQKIIITSSINLIENKKKGRNKMDLTEQQIERYSRQIILKEIGGIGQEKLLNSTITIVGAGGLGCPVALYLTAAGIGNIKIVDFDVVDLSNLHRQILHFTPDVNTKKVESAYDKLHKLNPDVNLEIIDTQLLPHNVKEIFKGSDFVIEGSDNIQTKTLVNDACVNLNIPFSIAGVIRFNGQIITVVPEQKTACYRCVFGDITDTSNSMSCSQAGVIGLIPGIIGSIQANEAIKSILNIGDLIKNRILFLDLLKNSFSSIEIKRNKDCMACGENAEDLVKIHNYKVGDACLDES